MSIAAPLPIISVETVLANLGFKPSGDGLGHLVFDFGNLVLQALPCRDQYLRKVVHFGGIYRTPNSLQQIEFDIPEKVESAQQVMAWIAYGMGGKFKPRIPCPWYEEGLASQDVLPWGREMRAYEDRPLVWVPRAWMRLAAADLRQAAEAAPQGQVCTIDYDGRTLEFDLGRRVIPLPAVGMKPWEHSFQIRLRRLRFLPRRWMTDPVPCEVWKERIRFGRLRFDLDEDDESA